jgi:DNA-binding NarL/FixJ family response regulator
VPRPVSGTYAVQTRAHVLIVDDIEVFARTLGRVVKRYAEPVLAGSREAVLQALAAGGPIPAAAIVDVVLDDASGFEVVDDLRARDGDMPIMMISGTLHPNVINQSYLRNLPHLAKPFAPEDLRSFLDSPAVRARLPEFADHEGPVVPQWWTVPGAVAAVVARFTRRYELTPKEAAVLALVAQRVPRPEIVTRLGVAESTLKTHVTNLLEKTRQPNLTMLHCLLLSDVLERQRRRG